MHGFDLSLPGASPSLGPSRQGREAFPDPRFLIPAPWFFLTTDFRSLISGLYFGRASMMARTGAG
jgi:hypothetical protein